LALNTNQSINLLRFN